MLNGRMNVSRFVWFLLFFHRTPEFKADPKQMNRDWLIARALFVGFIFYALIMSGIGYILFPPPTILLRPLRCITAPCLVTT